MPPKSIWKISKYDAKMVAGGRALQYLSKVAVFHEQKCKNALLQYNPQHLEPKLQEGVKEKEPGSLEQCVVPGLATNSDISKFSSGWMKKIFPMKTVRQWQRLPTLFSL